MPQNIDNRITLFAVGFATVVFDVPTVIMLKLGFDRQWPGFFGYVMPALFLLWGWGFATLSRIIASGGLPGFRDLVLILLFLVAGFLFNKAFLTLLEGLRLAWQTYQTIFILLLVMLLGGAYMFRSFFPTAKRFRTFLIGLVVLAVLFSVWAPARSAQPGIAGYCFGFWLTMMAKSFSGY